MAVAVHVLGPLEVVFDGRPVLVSGGKERALLVRLALQAGRVVPSDRLMEALWDGVPPASAEASLRVLVSRVRKALSAVGADHAIGTRSPGYVLAAEVDAARFEALSVRGRGELAAGRPEQAWATLTEALALWRGDRLAEVGTEYLLAEADRLDEARLTVLEARIDSDLACGRHGEVLGELAALCSAHRYREGLWAKWITALYRCGRQADALSAYHDLRSTLVAELGIDPSPGLRGLEAAVLAQDPDLLPRASFDAHVWTLPAPLHVVEGVSLVGRDRELHTVTSAWAACCGGTSATVLVSGEAGIGKSRLLRELARPVQQGGGIVLHGRCDPELAMPYQPFVEGLSGAITTVPARVLADLDPRQVRELARLIPALSGREPVLSTPIRDDPGADRHLLFGAVVSLLAALARTAPVLMILDDLHWADRPTLALLRHVAGVNLGRVLLVGAHRNSERPDGPLVGTLGALHRDAAITRVVLRGVTEAHAVAVMACIAGLEPDDAAGRLARLLHHETAGNPFYLTEMLRHLLETGVITGLPGGRCTASVDISTAGLPDSIREVVRARLARLGADTTRVLSHAAVIGEEFDVDVLAHTTGLDESLLLDLLEAVGRTGLVHESHQVGRFRFAHALVQHTVYSDIGPTRRTRTHAQVAATMETLGGHEPGEIAYHYLAGIASATTEKAVFYARAAAERALAMSAPEDAVRWYSAALNALPPPRDDLDHARAQLDLGVAQRQAGHGAYRDTLFAAAATAKRHGDDDLLVEVALATYRGGFSSLGLVDSEKVAVLESALAVAAPDTAERAQLLATLAGELAWHPDWQRRIALADEAVSLARRTGDPAILFSAITRPGPASWVPERSEQRVRRFREAVELADHANDPIARFEALGLLVPTLLERAEADRLDHAHAAAAELVAADLQEPFARWIGQFVRSCMAIVRGDLDLAEALGTQALRIGLDGGLTDSQAGHDEVLGIIRWHQGRLAEVLPELRTALARLPGLPTRWAGLALAEAVSGDPVQAAAILREASDHDFALLYGPAWLGGMCQWATVAAELGDRDAGAVLYTTLLPWKHLFGTGGPMPVHGVSHCLGRLAAMLGHTDDAGEHFADAWRTHRRMRAPFYTAETGFHWGQLLRDSDSERARHLLTHALELARRYGFTDVERRAEITLASA
jgi:DNA-binding SARP family transcriptional activator